SDAPGCVSVRCAHSNGCLTDLPRRSEQATAVQERTMRTWMCLICGWVYDEEAGLPDEGIAPGTRWEDVPPNWVCPECGARKEDFELMEI
ncbi:rubredoxin, partial [Bordetella bronchiseptica SBL-F6116]